MTKKKRGRPKLGAKEERGSLLSIRLKKFEMVAVKDAAHASGQKPSAWARVQIINAAVASSDSANSSANR